MKTCSKCSIKKLLTEFYKDKTKRDGLHSNCKECNKLSVKNFRILNPDYDKNYCLINAKVKNLKTKQWANSIQGVYEIYSNKICLYVGQSKQLKNRISEHKTHIKSKTLSTKLRAFQLYNSLRTHINVSIRVIEECSQDILLEREQHYIDTKKPLYNNHNSSLTNT